MQNSRLNVVQLQQAETGGSGGDPAGSPDPRLRDVFSELRNLLYDRGISQAEVERKAGWPERYLSRMFHGRVDMKLKHLFAALDAAEVDPRAFFARLASIESPPPGRLSDAERRTIVREVLGRLREGGEG